MNTKVCKFGGSSVANASQIKKVAEIIRSDNERRIIVVSAPKGVTDLLIQCTKSSSEKIFPEKEFGQIQAMYDEIGNELGVSKDTTLVLEELRTRIIGNNMSKRQHEDFIKSWGEYSS